MLDQTSLAASPVGRTLAPARRSHPCGTAIARGEYLALFDFKLPLTAFMCNSCMVQQDMSACEDDISRQSSPQLTIK
jgi:hypothetical protein